MQFVIRDDNGASHIEYLEVTVAGAASAFSTHRITPEERAQRAYTMPGGDGFSVWDPVPGDGAISAAFHYVFPRAGNYDFTVTGGRGGFLATQSVEVRATAPLMVEMVAPDGAPTNSWGKWHAIAGATDVRSRTYLSIQLEPNQDGIAVIDFSDAAFQSPQSLIPIDGNMQFHFARTSAGVIPAAVDTWETVDGNSGSLTLRSQGFAQMLVGYTIERMPWPLPDEDYQASFTVNSA